MHMWRLERMHNLQTSDLDREDVDGEGWDADIESECWVTTLALKPVREYEASFEPTVFLVLDARRSERRSRNPPLELFWVGALMPSFLLEYILVKVKIEVLGGVR